MSAVAMRALLQFPQQRREFAPPSGELVLDLPEKLAFLYGPGRYKVLYGGRGGAKSWNIARALLVRGYERRLRILCCREIQRTLADSVHRLLVDQIDLLGFHNHYAITENAIRGTNGTEFIFAGLHANVRQIKSLEGIDVAWVEEAETVSAESWDLLIPTVRKAGSEIWISFNPNLESDATWQRFVAHTPPHSVVVETSWADNPWLPDELREEKDYAYQLDPEMADHVWGGAFAPLKAGRVYSAFRRALHVQAIEYESCLDLILACDFNVHAMRWLIAQESPHELRVLDEIALGEEQSTEAAAREFVARWESRHKGAVIITGDATGQARRSSSTGTDYTVIRDELAGHFGSVRLSLPGANPPVLERVAAVNFHLAGRGKKVLIHPECRALTTDFERVAWREGSSEIDKRDPDLTHASDAFGYLVWQVARPRRKRREEPAIQLPDELAVNPASAENW